MNINVCDNLITRAKDFLDETHSRLTDTPPLQLIGLLTLGLLSFYNYNHQWMATLIPVCLVLAIIYRSILQHPLFWGVIASAATFTVWNHWHPVANHKFLTTYWLWALAFSAWLYRNNQSQADDLIKHNARFLILFTMLGACIQKFMSPTYMDRSFFEMALLTESYFRFLLDLLQVSPALINETNNSIAAMHQPNVLLESIETTWPISQTYHYFALFVTVWNLGMQMVLELFGLFKHNKCRIIFHVSMLIFIHSTYIAAPFIGFGWLLCIMLYTFSRDTNPRLATLYLISIPVMICYASPWRQML